MNQVAISLAEKDEYADAYGPGTSATAHVAPVYPFLLSRIYALFGTGTRGEIAQELFSTAVASFAYALLPYLSLALNLDIWVGLIAAVIGALLPLISGPKQKGSWEAALTGFVLGLLCLFIAVSWRDRRFGAMRAVVGRTICGVGALIAPAILPVLFATALIGAGLFWEQARRYVRFIGIVSSITILVMLPWAIRNRMVLGKLIFTRSNLGLEMMLSNNYLASADFRNNEQVYPYHPFSSTPARELRARLGEVGFEDLRMRQAMDWIKSHPAKLQN